MFPTILMKIRNYAENLPDHVALVNPNTEPAQLTYKELFCKAALLADYILENTEDNKPIVVYGHKNPYMIVCFFACVLSGHAYCPVDISMPEERIEMILDQTQSSLMFAVENFKTRKTRVVSLSQVEEICNADFEVIPSIKETCVTGDCTYYIIFTSGSTGTPKGVEITAEDLDNFLIWSSTLGAEAAYGINTKFLNQAPFSFDLSVMDLYTSLYCGGTLCMMGKNIQKDLSAITPFIKDNEINAMVVTPSFVNMCLVDKRFSAENIPSLESFFFCGETLSNKTARKLVRRFPSAVIQNTYGPTESTVAVSDVRINEDTVNKYDPLPVGKAKPGTTFIISDYEGREEDGHRIGEVLIAGNTLAKGYFRRRDLTDKAFIEYLYDGKKVRAYRTGDLGYIDKDQLFYCGRIDLQIKLNGYRIELGDIENCILKLDYVDNCAVVPRMNGDKIKALVGVIVLNDKDENQKQAKENIKEALYKQLPGYMVPQQYEFVNSIPMTSNGKADRKKLIAQIKGE